MDKILPNPVITFMVEYQGKFAMIKRAKTEENYPGLWAFPGGKVEIGENVVGTIRREVLEELDLTLTDEFVFLNTYFFGKSVGFTFLVRAVSDKITITEDAESFIWVSTLEEMEVLGCIPGIYNHLVDAKKALGRGVWQSLEEANLVKEKYLNTK